MAILIEIKKINENDNEAFYTFSPRENEIGKLRIDKTTGEIQEIEPLKGDKTKFYYVRAGSKVHKNHVRGEYPSKMFYEA